MDSAVAGLFRTRVIRHLPTSFQGFVRSCFRGRPLCLRDSRGYGEISRCRASTACDEGRWAPVLGIVNVDTRRGSRSERRKPQWLADGVEEQRRIKALPATRRPRKGSEWLTKWMEVHATHSRKAGPRSLPANSLSCSSSRPTASH